MKNSADRVGSGKPGAADGRVRRGELTRARLIEIATELFARDGYDATPTEAVLQAAGTSKGALYHHFGGGKEALFEAVFAAVETSVISAVVAAASEATNAREALTAGCQAWLRFAGDPVVRRIVLVDAPNALGWARWRELDEIYALGLLRAGVQQLIIEAHLDPALTNPLAHMLLAACNELALVVAHADNPATAVDDANAAIEVILATVSPSPSASR